MAGKPRARAATTILREQAFAVAIADPESSTYANGTQAALRAGIGHTLGSAKVAASRMLRRPTVQTEIDKVLAANGLTIEVRSAKLRSLLDKSDISESVYDSKGNLLRRRTKDASDIHLRTIHMLNKMDGTYSKADAVGHATGKVLDALVDEYSRKLRAEVRKAGQDQAGATLDQAAPLDSVQSITEPLEPATVPQAEGSDRAVQLQAGDGSNSDVSQ